MTLHSLLRRSFPFSCFLRRLMIAAVCLPVASSAQSGGTAAVSAQAPIAYASVSELNDILAQLQQTTKNMQTDLKLARIEKWKTDNGTKRQTLADVDSIQRNLQDSLPQTIAQLNAAPEDLGTSFKLYRNLDALYDVFGSVAEAAGAFGSKDEYQSLANDLNGLSNSRRAFAERIQKLAASKEEELARLRTQVKTLTAAPPPPPKKVVVDDTEPERAKKPVKKKAAKPATMPPASIPPPAQ